MKNILTFLIALCFTSSMFAQQDANALHDIRVDVVYLASDYLEGRETGTKGETLAAKYIARRFERLGLTPKGTDGTWYQPFDFKYKSNPHSDKATEERTGKNVVAYLDNGAAQTIVIGGHYDHLGKGVFGSLHAGEEAIHNGADDNASGIAAMFHIATHLKQSALKNNNYLFIAFSGEEMGLYGSKAYVNNPTIDLKQVNYMINMDMVGRLNEEKVLAISGAGTSPVWKGILEKIEVGGIQVKATDSGVGPSDHTSFYLKDIPVLHFFSGQHTDYHKPGDDSHLVNFEGIYNIAEFIIAIIEDLDEDGKIAFTKTKDEQAGKTAAKFKVTLGVMPDYVYTGEGMRIDAVLDGRVAAKAGLENGDIVIKIGDTEVKDIYGYMKGLSNYKAGDKAKVVVKRGEKTVEKMVTF